MSSKNLHCTLLSFANYSTALLFGSQKFFKSLFNLKILVTSTLTYTLTYTADIFGIRGWTSKGIKIFTRDYTGQKVSFLERLTTRESTKQGKEFCVSSFMHAKYEFSCPSCRHPYISRKWAVSMYESILSCPVVIHTTFSRSTKLLFFIQEENDSFFSILDEAEKEPPVVVRVQTEGIRETKSWIETKTRMD